MARGEGIKKVSDLFETYRKRLKAPQKTIVSSFQEVVRDLYGIEVKAEYVTYTPFSRTLSLKAPGTLKTEIILRKGEILAHIKGRLGVQNAPKDII